MVDKIDQRLAQLADDAPVTRGDLRRLADDWSDIAEEWRIASRHSNEAMLKSDIISNLANRIRSILPVAGETARDRTKYCPHGMQENHCATCDATSSTDETRATFKKPRMLGVDEIDNLRADGIATSESMKRIIESREPTSPQDDGLVELLPCPFCGSKPDESRFFSHDDIEYLQIMCPEGCATLENENHAEIRAAWNRRAPDPCITALKAQVAEVTRERDKFNDALIGKFNVATDCAEKAEGELTAARSTIAAQAGMIEEFRLWAGQVADRGDVPRGVRNAAAQLHARAALTEGEKR